MADRDPRPDVARNTVTGDVNGVAIQIGRVDGHVTVNQYGRRGPDAPEAVAIVTRLAPAAPDGELVGRDDEVSQVLAILAPHAESGTGIDGRAGAGRVVVSAMGGMGGIGKTALARHCASVAAGRGWFPGGVLWVDMQGYRDDGMVAAAVVYSPLLRRLGVEADRIPEHPDDQAAEYDKELRRLGAAGQPVLLVFDNVATADQIERLLPTGGGHRALVTTRDTLVLPGTRRVRLDVLPTEDAVAVLGRALWQQNPDDVRVPADPLGAAQLAEACGGLPLALLIATGLLTDEPNLTPRALAGQLAKAGTAGFTYGEIRLTAVLAVSYNRLHRRDPDAARMLRLLALAPGVDIHAEAAAALAGRPAVAEARSLLRVLLQAYLVTAEDDRWRMHDLVRRYIVDHGTNGDGHDDDNAITRLFDHYLEFARAADDHLRALSGTSVTNRFADHAEALARMDVEHPNLAKAAHWAAAAGRHRQTADLAAALHEYLKRRRVLSDLFAVHDLAVIAAGQLDDPRVYAVALVFRGETLTILSRFAEAATDFEMAYAHYRDLGLRLGQATALNGLGMVRRGQRRLDEAVVAHRTAIDLSHEADGPHHEAVSWAHLGATLVETRQFAESVAANTFACGLFHDIGNRYAEAAAWDSLGDAQRELGRLTEAIAAHESARDLYREAGDRHSEAMAWRNIGVDLLELGRLCKARAVEVDNRLLRDAVAALQNGLNLCGDHDDRLGEAIVLDSLGVTMQELGNLDEAVDAHETARAVFHDFGNPRRAAAASHHLGLVLRKLGRVDEANVAHQYAHDIFRDLGDDYGATEARRASSALDGNFLSAEHCP